MSVTNRKSIQTGKHLYECDLCGYLAPWCKDWLWYGSIKELEEDPTIPITFCSPECIQKYREKQFANGETPIPPFEETPDG